MVFTPPPHWAVARSRYSCRCQTSLSLTGGINVASLEVDSSDSLVPNLQSVSRISIGLAATIPTSELRLSLILRAQLNARQDSDPE